jgi:hypothetical protein
MKVIKENLENIQGGQTILDWALNTGTAALIVAGYHYYQTSDLFKKAEVIIAADLPMIGNQLITVGEEINSITTVMVATDTTDNTTSVPTTSSSI